MVAPHDKKKLWLKSFDQSTRDYGSSSRTHSPAKSHSSYAGAKSDAEDDSVNLKGLDPSDIQANITRIKVFYEEEDAVGRMRKIPYKGVVTMYDRNLGLKVWFDGYPANEQEWVNNNDEWYWASSDDEEEDAEEEIAEQFEEHDTNTLTRAMHEDDSEHSGLESNDEDEISDEQLASPEPPNHHSTEHFKFNIRIGGKVVAAFSLAKEIGWKAAVRADFENTHIAKRQRKPSAKLIEVQHEERVVKQDKKRALEKADTPQLTKEELMIEKQRAANRERRNILTGEFAQDIAMDNLAPLPKPTLEKPPPQLVSTKADSSSDTITPPTQIEEQESEKQLLKSELARKRKLIQEQEAEKLKAHTVEKILRQEGGKRRREEKLEAKKKEEGEDAASKPITSIHYHQNRTGITLSFPPGVPIPPILAGPTPPATYPAATTELQKYGACKWSGLPAKYRDPCTGIRYGSVEAFKALRAEHAKCGTVQ